MNTPSKTPILLINTQDLGREDDLSRSELEIIRKLGEGFSVRVVTAVGGLDQVRTPEKGIILGGSRHSVNAALTWTHEYMDAIQKFVAQGKYILGICFGFQIMAKALGGEVRRAKNPQFGCKEITRNTEELNHPMFKGIPPQFTAASSHFDQVVALGGGKLLASTTQCSNYAASFGDRAWGVQWHPEMEGPRLKEIIGQKKKAIPEWEAALESAQRMDATVTSRGATILQNFGRRVAREQD